MIAYVNLAKQLLSDLKAMDVDLSDQEVSMTVLCGLSSRFEHLIVAFDALGEDARPSLDFVESRPLQEEQRMMNRSSQRVIAADSAFFVQSA